MVSAKRRPHDVDAWIQFHLLRIATFHPETTKGDLAVLAEVIQRYHGQHGNGWASHEHLGSMAGVHKTTVIRSKRNLERLGFITIVAPGRRGSATVYRPNFDLVPRKGSADATETLGSIDATETLDLGGEDATSTPEYGSTDDTPSYLQDRPTRAVSLIDRPDCAAPSAPHASGLTAAAAGPAEGWFEELWRAYYPQSGRGSIKAARAAYEKKAPDAEQHAAMVASAIVWQERWAAQHDPGAPRFTLTKWIDDEHYRSEPPTGYTPKARRRAKSVAPKPDFTIYPDEAHWATITRVERSTADEDGAKILEVYFTTDDGGLAHDLIVTQSPDENEHQQGDKALRALTRAAGIGGDLDDESALLGRRVKLLLPHGGTEVVRVLLPDDAGIHAADRRLNR